MCHIEVCRAPHAVIPCINERTPIMLISEHPEVHECAVLAHQLDDKRMALRAVVNLVKGNEPGEQQTRKLRNYVKSILTPYKSPRIFEYVAELPKTGTGKIDRQALIE